MMTLVKRFIANNFFRLPGSEVQLGSELASKMSLIKCNYKFSRDGGAVSAIDLKNEDGDDVVLPAGTLIWDGCVLVKDAIGSGGSATLAFGVAAADDIKTATAKTSFGANAKVALIEDGTVTNALLLTAEGTPQITIATAALTAGELDVFLMCMFQER